MIRFDQPTRTDADLERTAHTSSLPVLLPIILLSLAYLVAVYAAPDTATAWPRLVWLAMGIAATMILAFGGRVGGTGLLGWTCIGALFLAAGIVVYFALSHNWFDGNAIKFAPIQEAGRMIQLYRPALVFPDDINANVAGGALAVLLPLGFAGLLWAAGRDRPGALPFVVAFLVGVILLLLLFVGLLGLILTASRGAWLGTAAGIMVGAIVYARGKHAAWPAWVDGLLLLLILAVLVAVFWAAVFVPGVDRYLGSVASAGGSAIGRAQLWREMLALAGDYPFTGVGFGATMMTHASYALLTHVGYITHAHNFFLQLAVEAGAPALVAFLALAMVTMWGLLRAPADLFARLRRGPVRSAQRLVRSRLPFRVGAAAALTALVVHGMVDAGLYASRLAPLLFLPIGIGLALRGDVRIMRLAAFAEEERERNKLASYALSTAQPFATAKESVGSVGVGTVPVESEPVSEWIEVDAEAVVELPDADEYTPLGAAEQGDLVESEPVPDPGEEDEVGSSVAEEGTMASGDDTPMPEQMPQPAENDGGADVWMPASSDQDIDSRAAFPVGAVSIVAIVALLLALSLLRPVRAAFQANLGTVAQGWVELASYSWPEWPIQDALRNSPDIDLSSATDRYLAALVLDPGNVTANRRLGQIELSQGDYDSALIHLQVAEKHAPWERATRQLLGEAYAVSGDTARAAELWRTIDLSQGQLDARRYWYQSIGRDDLADRIAEAAP